MKKLKISKCSVSDTGVISETGTPFEVMLNPGEYSLEKSIKYNIDVVPGQIGSDVKFCFINPDTLSLKLHLDGTGIVRKNEGKELYPEVNQQLETIENIIYHYDGSEHEPHVVKIVWGELIFYGRCNKFSIRYTLFNPDGIPVRANVDLNFKGYKSKEEQEKKKNASSPDMTHIITVTSGDSLPLLCYRIYNDCSWYRQVAKINNILEFRKLKPGMKLVFPPLKQQL